MNKKEKVVHHNQEVLFQKLGPNWYAFTQIRGEIIYSPLPKGINPHSTNIELFEIIEEHIKKIAKIDSTFFV